MRRVNVMSDPRGDAQLQLLADRLAERHLVGDLAQLAAVLEGLAPAAAPATLDLSGHSSMSAHHQLVLGRTVITAEDPAVIALFRRRRDHLRAVGIVAIRLLGCCTALPAAARRTIRELCDLVALPVFGAITLVGYRDYDATGFDPAYEIYLRDQDRLDDLPPCPLCACSATAD